MLNRRRKRINRFQNGGISNNYPRRMGYINDNLGNGYEDDVPAMLTAGEYVIKRGSVQQYGQKFLDRLNQGLVSNDVRHMNRGGQVTNGRNNMRNNSRTRRVNNRRPVRKNVNAVAYTSKGTRRPARRTAAPNRPTTQMQRPVTPYNRGGSVSRVRRPVRPAVRRFAAGGGVYGGGNRVAAPTRMVREMTYDNRRISGPGNGRNTMAGLTKYKDKYYDCAGSKYITTQCSEVASTMLMDAKTGKTGRLF